MLRRTEKEGRCLANIRKTKMKFLGYYSNRDCPMTSAIRGTIYGKRTVGGGEGPAGGKTEDITSQKDARKNAKDGQTIRRPANM